MEKFNFSIYVLVLFGMFVLHFEMSLSARVKHLLGIRMSRHVQLLDCFPCLTFWASCIVTAIYYLWSSEVYYLTPATCYLTAVALEKLVYGSK